MIESYSNCCKILTVLFLWPFKVRVHSVTVPVSLALKKSGFDSSLGKFCYLLLPPHWRCLYTAIVSSAAKPESFPNLQGQIKAAWSSMNLQSETAINHHLFWSAFSSAHLHAGGRWKTSSTEVTTCTRLIRTLFFCRLSNLLSCKWVSLSIK